MKKLCLFVFGLFSVLRGVAAEFYVSPQGSDSNAGTSAAPFATVSKARDAVRGLKNGGAVPAGGVTVWLRGGDYPQSETLAFDGRDSGAADRPVVYASAAGEQAHIVGARSLDSSWFSLVTSSSDIWGRLDASARGQVYAVNLFAHGISDLGTLKARGFVLRETAPLELFVNGEPMTLGRWPNAGTSLPHTASAPSWDQMTYSGSRPERWAQAKDIWMHGLWSQTWADYHVSVGNIDTNSKTISFAIPPAQYGVSGDRPYYAYNLLEEIDSPGEYYVDRSSGMLYLWPKTSLAGADILVSTLESSLLKLSGSQYVTFRGVVLEASRGPLVTVDSGDHVRFESSTLRNAGEFAALIGGSNNGFDQCEIADCGEEGVRLTGGDRASLTSANNYVSNTHIQRTAATAWTYKPGINFEGGCGNIASHNFLELMPHVAILFSGNNHLIESNEIARVCQSTSDAGAIYSGHDWGYRGNAIRYNFIHHIATDLEGYGAHGVYLDDCVSGVEVYGNIFYRISNTAIFCGGGRDNLMRNNIIALCGTAHHNDDRGRFQITNGGGDYWNLPERLTYDGIRYQDAPWSTAYPALAAIPNSWDQIQQGLWRNPQNSVFSDNAGWGNDYWTLEQNSSGTGVFSVYASLTNNNSSIGALFDDNASLNRSARAATLSAPVSGFQPIGFAAIGPSSVAVQQAPFAAVLDGAASSSFTIDLHFTAVTNVPAALPLGFELEQRADPSGAWQVIQSLGSQATVASVVSLAPATSYGFRLRAFNSIGSTYSNIVTIATPAVPAVPAGVLQIQAEDPLVVANDVGGNGTVGVSDGTLDVGQSVRLYDVGDAIRIAVPVAVAGNYRIGIRVRAGGTTGSTSLWPDGYRFKLDGTVFAAVGDTTTISALDPAYGGCYWGTMFAAPMTLSAGVHTVEVAAAMNWTIVDYLQIAPDGVITTPPAAVPPTVTVPSDLTVDATGPEGAVVTFSPSAQDSTGKALTVTSTPASGSTFKVGATTVSVSATDGAGNTSTKTFTVTVRAYVPPPPPTVTDTTPPTITVPAAITLEATNGSGAIANFSVGVSDSSGIAYSSVNPASGSVFPLGTTQVTASATDNAGNSATKTFTVAVRDTTAPAIVVPSAITLSATSTAGAVVTFATSASDAVSGNVATVSSLASGSTFPIGTTTVTVSATDGAGNVGSSSFGITVLSATVDAAWTSADIGVVNRAGSASGSGTAFSLAGSGADIWDSTIGFHYLYKNLSGDCSIVARVTSLQNTDGWAKAGLMIRDTLDPLAAFAGLYVTPDNGVAFQWRGAVGWSCFTWQSNGSAPAWLRLDRVGNVFNAFKSSDGTNWQQFASTTIAMGNGIYAGLAVTSHNAGALATSTFDSVRVEAAGAVSNPVPVVTPPTVTVPSDFAVDATSPAGAVVTFSASAKDSSGNALSFTSSPASGSFFGVGATTVSVSASDGPGNTATKTFTVTVRSYLPPSIVDVTPPVITVPAPLTVEATSASGAVVTFVTSAIDLGSGIASSSVSPASGSLFPLGTTTVLATASDLAGNVANKTFTITVRDTTPPVISVPANITLTAASTNGAVATFVTSATDAVSGSVATQNLPASGSTFPIGAMTVLVSARDGAGNSASGSFTVTVLPPGVAAPTGLIATAANATIQLTWNASAFATGYDLKRSTVDGGPYVVVASNLATTSFTDTALTNDTAYFYVVVAKSGTAASANSNQATATPTAGSDMAWTSSDIGAVNYAGHTAINGGVFTVSGSGADIWDSVVGFQYVYRSLTGDSSAIARVTGLQNTDAWAKAGLMVRESLDPAAPFAGLYLTPGNGVAFQWRVGNGWSCSTREIAATAPTWLRLDRVGNTFIAFKSADGLSWQQFASATIAMGAKIYVGLAVTAHNAGSVATATFDSVRAEAGDVASGLDNYTPGIAARFEAENSLTVLNDMNVNGTVGISDGMLDSGLSVRLYDAQDVIRVFFPVPADGKYRLAVRVRSGGTTGPVSLWPAGYRFKLDGNEITLTGDPATVSALDLAYGGCYWGTMTSGTTSLTPGYHTIDIIAAMNWAIADYVEVTPLLPSLSWRGEPRENFARLALFTRNDLQPESGLRERDDLEIPAVFLASFRARTQKSFARRRQSGLSVFSGRLMIAARY